MTFKDVWNKTVEALSDQYISENAMNMWIRPLEPIKYEDDSAIILSPDSFQRDIVMSRYKGVIEEVMSDIVGFEIGVKVITPEEHRPFSPKSVSKGNENFEKITNSIVHPEYTFENFIVGDSNRHAHAACLAVAQNPSGAYNPLFLHGPTGLGKTHLLYAIQNEITRRHPERTTIYIRSEDFTIELVENIKRNTMTEFKNKYRSVDVLMIDDIQFIAGKESTQDEFFHTFNTLYENNKQIILVSDRPPRDIQLLDDRLRSRFEMGLITNIAAPEYELKVAIISQRCQFYNLNLSEEIISFIAQHVRSNIRQIEGVLKKMMAYSLISKSNPNMAIAQSAIRDITNENQPLPVLIDKILLEVSREFEVSIDDICSSKRIEKITNARQIAMYIMREITPMSLPEIGKQFSNRDHSTVHHAIERVEQKISTNSALKLRIDDLIKNIKEK